MIISFFAVYFDNASDKLSDCIGILNTTNSAFIYLQTLSISGCRSLTNLTSMSIPFTYSLTYLKLSNGGLQFVSGDALNDFGTTLHHLDLAHNELQSIPSDFFGSLTNLEILNLSNNKFVSIDVSPFHLMREFIIDNSPFLITLELTQKTKTKFQDFSAHSNPKLSQFCLWILWGSPDLQKLNIGEILRLQYQTS